MSADRKAAVWIGVLYIIGTVALVDPRPKGASVPSRQKSVYVIAPASGR
jgi:hypothetical protein